MIYIRELNFYQMIDDVDDHNLEIICRVVNLCATRVSKNNRVSIIRHLAKE